MLFYLLLTTAADLLTRWTWMMGITTGSCSLRRRHGKALSRVTNGFPGPLKCSGLWPAMMQHGGYQDYTLSEALGGI